MKLVRNTVLIIFITFLILIGAECLLRFIYPVKSIPAYIFNPAYLIELKPNTKKIFKRSAQNGGNIISWSTNSNGFRGEELKRNIKNRLIVYGDSNIQARFSKLENTFPKKLEHYLLQENVLDVEVINAGIIGNGPDQNMIRFKKMADIYKPNIVIFHIFADNDFGDILRNNLFTLDYKGNLLRTVTKRLKAKQINPWHLDNLLITRAAKKITRKTPASIEVVEDLFKATKQEYAMYKSGKQGDHFGDHYDIDVATIPTSESSKLKIMLFEKILKELHDYARIKGIHLIVLIQPSVVDLTTNYSSFSYKDLYKYTDYKPSNLTSFIHIICKKNNIHSLNLFDIFLNNHPEKLFFKVNDNHWNDLGQDLAARELSKYILKHSILQKKTKLNHIRVSDP